MRNMMIGALLIAASATFGSVGVASAVGNGPVSPASTAATVPGGELSFIANCSRAAGFTSHGRDQAQKRGISEDMINQAIQSGSRSKGNSKGTTKYKGTKVWVVLNTRCAVVSTGWN
ncbi:DUF4258 domain-containing protein [Nocardia grenadensis]|uniref:DUF4258 domain-containing protein n=1 Tax=Nocardia grenadensis TaxID=931537 RepID=UPI0007A55AAE|nr:DUF4258 domain-containing protein [Nocardia grenadensis]